MAEVRTRKNKENPHYGFLVSWSPTRRVSDPEGKPPGARVKRELNSGKINGSATFRHKERAESMAQGAQDEGVRKSIVKSLVLIGLILILELVVYLAWSKFVLS